MQSAIRRLKLVKLHSFVPRAHRGGGAAQGSGAAENGNAPIRGPMSDGEGRSATPLQDDVHPRPEDVGGAIRELEAIGTRAGPETGRLVSELLVAVKGSLFANTDAARRGANDWNVGDLTYDLERWYTANAGRAARFAGYTALEAPPGLESAQSTYLSLYGRLDALRALALEQLQEELGAYRSAGASAREAAAVRRGKEVRHEPEPCPWARGRAVTGQWQAQASEWAARTMELRGRIAEARRAAAEVEREATKERARVEEMQREAALADRDLRQEREVGGRPARSAEACDAVTCDATPLALRRSSGSQRWTCSG